MKQRAQTFYGRTSPKPWETPYEQYKKAFLSSDVEITKYDKQGNIIEKKTVMEQKERVQKAKCQYRVAKLQKRPTPSEQFFWDRLTAYIYVLNTRFDAQLPQPSFQHPIFYDEDLHFFIIDIFFKSYNLAIEIDGPIHKRKAAQAKDERRDRTLMQEGIKTIRFTNDQADYEYTKVLLEVIDAIEEAAMPKMSELQQRQWRETLLLMFPPPKSDPLATLLQRKTR